MDWTQCESGGQNKGRKIVQIGSVDKGETSHIWEMMARQSRCVGYGSFVNKYFINKGKH